MSDHTPGPWTYEADPEDLGGFVLTLGDVTERTQVEQEIEYAEGLFPEDGDQWRTAEANARLIAAAPDLLYGLQVVSEQSGHHGHGDDPDRFYCEFCEASHLDYTRIKHSKFCVMTGVREAIANAGGD